jgi:lysophospholipase L1-like esterase
MKTIAAFITRFFYVLFLVIIASSAVLSAQTDEQTVSFHWNNQLHRVSVEASSAGCDIILTNQGIQNLSAGFPGENLFPKVTVNPSARIFTVAWMHFVPGNIQLCIYDSRSNNSRILPLEGFKYAVPIKTVFRDEDTYLLLFLGDNSNNTDIFYYNLHTGLTGNLTQTPDSEQEYEITDEKNRFFIETKTLFHKYRYRVKKSSLTPELLEKKDIERGPQFQVPGASVPAQNTILGFGDSITYGVVRMDLNNCDDYYHPELTYLAQLKQILTEGYGAVETVNAGVSRNTSYNGIDRMHEVFSESGAYFCLVMFGTNDVVAGLSADVSAENLAYILNTARSTYSMYPIVSTIPPQKDEERGLPGVQYYTYQTEALNAAIIEMAEQNNVPFIDTYTAFMEHPEGWEAMLELCKGNHPSPLGHEVIAGLFKEKILELPPAKPVLIRNLDTTNYKAEMEWAPNEEFDFSHYLIEYGYTMGNLTRTITTTSNHYTFIMFPFYRPVYSKLYFRLQAVDRDGNTRGFTEIQAITFKND